MRQIFHPGADAILRLSVLVAAGSVVTFFMLVGGVPNSFYATGVGEAPHQTPPFSHKHHAGELGIDCLYCHTSATSLATPGMPPTHVCMTCHSQIWNKAAMLAPVRDSLAHDTPLDWARVNRVPDYVYFNHAIHVSKGIGCSSCHGPVTQMQLTWPAQNFTMEFCLTCHRNPQNNLRKPADVWNMEWKPGPDQDTLGRQLMAAYHIASKSRLTDCSTCHR